MNHGLTVCDNAGQLDIMLDGELFEVVFDFTTYRNDGSEIEFGAMSLLEDGSPIDEQTVKAAYEGDLENDVMFAHTADCADRY